MTVPQTLTLSLHQQIDEHWAVLATLGWQDWSEFGEVAVEVDTSVDSAGVRTIGANYQDTWHLSLGARVQHASTPARRVSRQRTLSSCKSPAMADRRGRGADTGSLHSRLWPYRPATTQCPVQAHHRAQLLLAGLRLQ